MEQKNKCSKCQKNWEANIVLAISKWTRLSHLTLCIVLFINFWIVRWALVVRWFNVIIFIINLIIFDRIYIFYILFNNFRLAERIFFWVNNFGFVLVLDQNFIQIHFHFHSLFKISLSRFFMIWTITIWICRKAWLILFHILTVILFNARQSIIIMYLDSLCTILIFNSYCQILIIFLYA